MFLIWQSLEILNVFNTLTLKQVFRKTQTLFKKLEYCFLVESTKIENATFSLKTALTEANVKTNRIRRTKWTYRKERSFASNYFIFAKILFRFKSWLNVPTTQMSIFIVFERVGVWFEGTFSQWIFLTEDIFRKKLSICSLQFHFQSEIDSCRYIVNELL